MSGRGWAWRGLGGAAVLGLAIGCGDAIALEDLTDAFLAAACEQEVACEQFPDEATCRAATKVDLSLFVAAVEAGTVRYDAEAAPVCIEAMTPSHCLLWGDGDRDRAERGAEACRRTFRGAVELGGTCAQDFECAGEARCGAPICEGQQCCLGSCVPVEAPLVAEIGDSCAGATCVPEAYCNVAAICTARLGAGEPCDAFNACATGALCSASAGEGTCVALAGRGEPCDPGFLYDVGSCESITDYCDRTETVCKARKLPGERCAESRECVGYAFCRDEVCVLAPAAGEACDPMTGPCLGHLHCMDGICGLAESPPVCIGA